MKKYGYVRVSSKDQNPDRQLDALNGFGIPAKNIYVDKMSGKNFARPSYLRLRKRLREGDLLVIDMPLLNTNYERDGLTGVFISDLVLQILAYVAQTERELIHQRQAEGIASAKARGVRFGARRIEVPCEFERYYQLWKIGKISVRNAAKELVVSYSTFYRRCMEKSKKGNGKICL